MDAETVAKRQGEVDMSVMTKIYILLDFFAAAIFAIVGGRIAWKKRRNIPHDCTTCAHCVLVDRGADGKLIYTCGIDRGKEPKVYYEKNVPVYCGWVTELRRMRGIPVYLKSKGADFEDGWNIITSVEKSCARFQPEYKMLKWEDYGKTWMARRFEPDEVSENG